MIKNLLFLLAFLVKNVVMFYAGYWIARETLTTEFTIEIQIEREMGGDTY